MSTSRSRSLPVLLAALLLVGGLAVPAYAANGHPLLLGRSNHESSASTLHNTGTGSALRLQSRAGTPSLSVSSRVKVAGLGADRVDGYQGADLGTRVRTYQLGGDGDESDVVKSFPGLPHGLYLVRYVFYANTYNATLSCWLDTGTGKNVLPSSGSGGSAVLTAEGQVDARNGVRMRCTTAGIFDSLYDDLESQITFLRLTTSVVRDASTTVVR